MITGFTKKIYGVQLKDKEKKMQSQSGGAFTALAESVLDLNGIVYGVRLNDEMVAVYDSANSKSELSPFKGSKYVQARVGDCFKRVKEDLISGRIVLFEGTPCCVKGLLRFLDVFDTSNLYTCDIICHGVASPLIYKEYIHYIQKKYKKIDSFVFRDKQKGWHSNFETFRIGNKKYTKKIYAELFKSATCLRESCYNCPFTNYKRNGDITIGDFWGIENSRPNYDDNTGISLMMINTSKGEMLFEKIKNELFIFESNEEECKQPQLITPALKSQVHDSFWIEYKNKRYSYILFKYGKGGLKEIIKDYLKKLTKHLGLYKYIHNLKIKQKY
jgi:coenzyme F420-reducing hydrogenase beta subunit